MGQDAPAMAGDRVLVRILRDSILVDTLRIDARGMAVVPLAGDVRLGGVAGNAVQDTLRARLSRFVNPGAVEATLLRRVRVLGDVNKPGVYYVDRTFTLRDALALAQGVAESGDDRRATLERAGTRHELRDWHTDAAGLWPIESGDQLLVERLPWYRRNVVAFATTAASVLASLIITLSR
jgi:polysaccharide export outer membrane protein